MMLKAAVSPAILLGIAFFGSALIAYSFVLSKINLSIAYPVMTSIGFLIVITASALFFKETITIIQMAGFILILAGVWLVAR
ncbi:MAG: SMR family transporter [Actinomycetota bacterium]|nr:SMR family transporter [Actinomycetota bacterium]